MLVRLKRFLKFLKFFFTRKRIYIICSVRNAPEDETKKILAYAQTLRDEGHKVRCPPENDKNLQDDGVGLGIVEGHEIDITWAEEIHVIYNPNSEGSQWDIAQTRMAMFYEPDKKFYIANVWDMSLTKDEGGNLKKCYKNVIAATHFGFTAKDITPEKLEKKFRVRNAPIGIHPPKRSV